MNLRPLTREDADAVAAIASADEAALRGRPSHLGSQDVLKYAPRGGSGRERPAVARTARSGCTRSCSPRTRLQRAFFEQRGYREVRRFYEMAIELEAPPPAPAVPGGLALDAFHEDDARAFHAAIGDAFADSWEYQSTPFDESWAMRRGQERDEDGPLWFVVRDGDEIAATIRNETRGGGGYVAVLAVRPPWRGRGLGRALLHRSFAEFWRRGLTRVTLGVDSESPTGATKLYESVGMTVESSLLTYEKALR